jgi:predicted nucleic acid-binding protein
VGNVLWKWVYFSRQSIKLAEEAMNTADALLEESVDDLNWPVILALAYDSGFTFYDASYLWLAQALEIPMYTRDNKVLKHFPATAKVY